MKHALEAMKMTYNPFRPSERSLRRRVFGVFASKRSILGAFIVFSMVLAGIASATASVSAQDPSPTPTPTPTPVILVPEPADPPPFVPEEPRFEEQAERTPSGHAELDSDIVFTLLRDGSYSVRDRRSYTETQLDQRAACSLGTSSLSPANIMRFPNPILWQARRLKGTGISQWQIAVKTRYIFSGEVIDYSADVPPQYQPFNNTTNIEWDAPIPASDGTLDFFAGALCVERTVNASLAAGFASKHAPYYFMAHLLTGTPGTAGDPTQWLDQDTANIRLTDDVYTDGYAEIATNDGPPATPVYRAPPTTTIGSTSVEFAFFGYPRTDHYITGVYSPEEEILHSGTYPHITTGNQAFTHSVTGLATNSIYEFFVRAYYTPKGVHRGGVFSVLGPELRQDITVPAGASNPTDRRPTRVEPTATPPPNLSLIHI